MCFDRVVKEPGSLPRQPGHMITFAVTRSVKCHIMFFFCRLSPWLPSSRCSLSGILSLCETPEQSRGLETVTAATIDTVAGSRWVNYPFWVNKPNPFLSISSLLRASAQTDLWDRSVPLNQYRRLERVGNVSAELIGH